MEGSIFTNDIEFAANVLRKGGIVAFPTETSYGLAVDIFNENAVRKLYTIKKRDKDKPLLVLIKDTTQLEPLILNIPSLYSPLIDKFWPGALTLIFPSSDIVSNSVAGNSSTIGVRISSNKIANSLVHQFGGPVTATSANIQGEKPATSHLQVHEYFGDKIGCILTTNKILSSSYSTIVKAEIDKLILIREGVIPFAQILDVLN